MNTLLLDIKDFIEGSTEWVFGKDLFGAREPVKPNNAMTLFDTSDRGRFLPLNRDDDSPGSDAYQYKGLQIQVRHHDYNKAVVQLEAVVDILHGLGNYELNGTLYTIIEALDEPHLLDWDDNNRCHVVVNFSVQRTPFSL